MIKINFYICLNFSLSCSGIKPYNVTLHKPPRSLYIGIQNGANRYIPGSTFKGLGINSSDLGEGLHSVIGLGQWRESPLVSGG